MSEEKKVLKESETIINGPKDSRKAEKFKILSLLVAKRFGNDVFEELKQEVKEHVEGFSSNPDGEHLPENGYKRGIRETKEALIQEFSSRGYNDIADIIKNKNL